MWTCLLLVVLRQMTVFEAKTLMLDIVYAHFLLHSFIPSMGMGTIDFNHFISLLVALAVS